MWDGQERRKLTGSDLTGLIEKFHRENPGAERESFSEERSTWMLIGASVTAAAALSWPWNLISFAVGVIGALVPDGSVKP